MAKRIGKVNVAEISVKLTNGEVLIFQPKYNPMIKILRGISETQCDNFVERNLNGKEALIIVSAPEEIRKFFSDEGDLMFLIKQELNQ